MKRNFIEEFSSNKKPKYENVIPKDCLSIIFTFLDLEQNLQNQLVCKEWKEECLHGPLELYFNFLKLSSDTFNSEKLSEDSKMEHYLYFKSWIQAKMFMNSSEYEEFKIQKYLKKSDTYEKGISLIELDFNLKENVENVYRMVKKRQNHIDFIYPRIHYRLLIKSGTFIDLYCMENCEEEVSYAVCNTDSNYDFSEWNVKKGIKNTILKYKIQEKNTWFNRDFIKKVDQYFELNRIEKNELNIYRVLSMSKKHNKNNYLSNIGPKEFDHSFKFDENFNEKRKNYFEKYYHSIPSSEHQKYMKMLERAMDGYYFKYKLEKYPSKIYKISDLRGYIRQCGEKIFYQDLYCNCVIEHNEDIMKINCSFILKYDTTTTSDSKTEVKTGMVFDLNNDRIASYSRGLELTEINFPKEFDAEKLKEEDFKNVIFPYLSKLLPVYNTNHWKKEKIDSNSFLGKYFNGK